MFNQKWGSTQTKSWPLHSANFSSLFYRGLYGKRRNGQDGGEKEKLETLTLSSHRPPVLRSGRLKPAQRDAWGLHKQTSAPNRGRAPGHTECKREVWEKVVLKSQKQKENESRLLQFEFPVEWFSHGKVCFHFVCVFDLVHDQTLALRLYTSSSSSSYL